MRSLSEAAGRGAEIRPFGKVGSVRRHGDVGAQKGRCEGLLRSPKAGQDGGPAAGASRGPKWWPCGVMC